MIANKNKLHHWMPGRKYIKLISRRSQCPLSFNERLVYSLLVYASRKKKTQALSQRAIARLLQLDKDTVPKLLDQLIQQGLAERHDGGVVAKQPSDSRVNWFVYLNRPGCARWQDQYAYLLVALAEPCKVEGSRQRLKLKPHQIAVYCLLVNKERNERATISRASIAGLLGIDVRTVGSALSLLEGYGLVVLHPRTNIIVVNRPGETQLSWFQARKEPPKKLSLYDVEEDKPWEGMTAEEIEEWVSEPANEYARLLRRIRYCGRYSTTELDAIRKKAEQISFGYLTILTRLFNEAEREHQQTQNKGQFLGKNSFSLLNYKLSQCLERRGTGNLLQGRESVS
jgi:DNA-binding MarR family transcriptional regulator